MKRIFFALLALASPALAHPIQFNSAISYSPTQPSGGAASVSNWTGAAFDAANVGGSGVNADGGANNGAANDATTFVADNQPRQGQSLTTGSNANGYELTGVTVRMAGYTNNTATGANRTSWDPGFFNGPVLVEVGKISGTAFSTVSIQSFASGGAGHPGAGTSANGAGTYLTFTLPYAVHLEPNTIYGFDFRIGNGSDVFFEWLGTTADALAGGAAYTRSGATVTPLAGERVFMADMTATAAPYAPFSHPGTLHSAADLARMAAKVAANEQPWKSDYDQLAASPYAKTSWGSYNVDYINRGGANPNNYTRSQQDAQAIYELALRWHITGNTAYADRAVAIANVWSDLLGVTGDSNGSLAAGICGYLFAIGGELLSTYPGWPAAQKQAYCDMMMRVFYPANFDFLWRHHGTPVNVGGNTHYRLNWDTCNMASMAAIGVLCDNRAVYQQAVDYFKNGPGNGRVERAAWMLHTNGLAQGEEVGRDQGHNQGGWYCMALLCQIAWNQGDDLFAYDNSRVLRAFEYNAKYNLGLGPVPYTPHRNASLTYTEGAVAGAPGLGYLVNELVFQHYANIKGIAAPYCKLAADATRPEGYPHVEYHPSAVDWLGLATLTHTRDAIASGAAPSGLVGHWSKNRVVVNWLGSTYATGYNIKRAATSGGPFTTIGTAGAMDLNFTDTNVANGATYFYAVSANTPTGESADSAPLAMTQQLVSHYTFENTANDLVGARHGTLLTTGSTPPTFAAGKSGQAVSLDGANDYVQLPAGSGNFRDITVAAWVNWNGGGTWQRVFDFGTDIDHFMMLTVNAGSNLLRFQISTTRGAEDTLTLTGPAMPTATWTHLAVTLNGDTATLYVNGVPAVSGTSSKMTPLFGQPFCYLGRSMWNSDAFFGGRIDDFRIYNHALSGGDVYALWGEGGANSAPTFTSDPLTKPSGTEDAAYTGQTLAGDATDANGGTLTFSKISGPSWLSVASNGALSGTPTNANVGDNLFVVRVADTTGATDDANLHITVGNVNDAPAWDAPSITKPAVTRDQPYAFASATLAGDATDVDAGDTLTFSKVSGPAWLSVAANGALTGTPGVGDVGANGFTVRVTDSASAIADATLTITVLGHELRTHLLFENNTADSLGNANGTATGSPVFIPGRTAQSIVLDGVDDFLTLPDGALNYRDLTVAAWVYWEGGSTSQRIFDFGDDDTEFFYLRPDSTAGIRFRIQSGATQQDITAPALPTGQWVHVAVTLGGDTGTIYVNGVAVGTNTALTLNPDDLRPSNNLIGASQTAGDALLAGKLDDFRIYNYALTPGEIVALLDIAPAPPSGLAVTPRSARLDLTWLAAQGAQTYTLKRSTTSGSGYATVASGLAGTSFSDTGLINGTTYFYIVTTTNTHGESNPSAEASGTPSELLVYLKFDETTGTTAADNTGNGYDGTLENGTTFVAGTLGNAASFDGSNDRVTLPAGAASTAEITIAAWVWWNGGATSQRIFSFADDTNNFLNLSPSASAGKLKFGIRFAGGTEQSLLAASALPTNSWHHVAVTLAGGTGTLYLDGTVAASGAITFTPAQITPATLYIADSITSGDPSFAGKVDDFRIYTRALNAAELGTFTTAPTAPANVAALPGATNAVLTWNAVTSAVRYHIKRATTTGGPYTETGTSTALTFTDTALTSGTAYFYVITAESIAGTESADSAETTATPSILNGWLAAYFTPAQRANPAISALTADANGDGELNLMEFATAQNPLAASSATPALVMSGATLEFTYTRSLAAMADGVTFTVEWRHSLTTGAWETDEVAEQILTDNGSVQTIRASVPAGIVSRFVRLRVVR